MISLWKRNQRIDNRKVKDRHKLVKRYFDEEAEISGSENEDDDIEDDEEDDGDVLSGDFINDGEYTQLSGISPGLALYRSVDRRKFEDESPYGIESTPRFKFRGAEKGLPIIASILRRKRKKANTNSSKQYDTEDELIDDATQVSSTEDGFDLHNSQTESDTESMQDHNSLSYVAGLKDHSENTSSPEFLTSSSPLVSTNTRYIQDMLGDDDW